MTDMVQPTEQTKFVSGLSFISIHGQCISELFIIDQNNISLNVYRVRLVCQSASYEITSAIIHRVRTLCDFISIMFVLTKINIMPSKQFLIDQHSKKYCCTLSIFVLCLYLDICLIGSCNLEHCPWVIMLRGYMCQFSR